MPSRPAPPLEMLEAPDVEFEPAPDLAEWALETFIAEDALLLNKDHAHLRYASIGFLWTNVVNTRQMLRIVGQAEPGARRGMGAWAKSRAELQLREWFGSVPDFLITLDAVYAERSGDAEFCSLVEHELYHCGQARDDFGAPKFTKYGRPVFAMRGHDVEEFVGIVRRYGVGAAAGETLALVEAAQRAPQIAAADIRSVCATCLQVA